jgi:hypothetical protein
MEPDEAAPDLVGRTSARLLAAGVDRRARVDALRLLAILDASTDHEGRVRRPLDDLAAEFELPALGVLESIDHLEDAGALQRDGATVIVLGDGARLGGMRLADFLEDVQASFDGVPAVESRRPTWLVRSGAALVAAAAAFAIFSMAPTTTPTAVEQLAASSTTVTSEATTTTAEAQPTPTTEAATPVPGTDAATVAPPVDSTLVGAAACPTGSPVVSIVEDVVRIANPTDEDLQVTSLTVGGITITTPIDVPAGESVVRPIVAVLTDDGPTIDAWEWADSSVARTCPS